MNSVKNASCPQCSSGDTQSFEMAYKTGTSTGAFVGVSQNGNLGIGGGQSPSILAKTVKPPEEVSVSDSLFYIIVAVLVFNAIGGVLMVLFDPFVGLFTALGLTVAVGVFAIIKGRGSKEEKRRRFQAATNRWRRSWICLRCGHSFVLKPLSVKA